MSIERHHIGRRVMCDSCGKEWTDLPDSGGVLFETKAYGPCCLARVEESILRYKEERFVKARCPAGMSFANWVHSWRESDEVVILTDEDAIAAIFGVPVQIGDGTAPPGWPAYSAVAGEPGRVECRYEGCGHRGDNGSPCKMDCQGLSCECSCCRMLAGAKVHGCTVRMIE